MGVRHLLAVLVAGGLGVAACSSSPAAQTTVDPTTGATVTVDPTPTAPPPELPQGGREVFPTYRLVGYSGVGGDVNEDLGRLTGDLDADCQEIRTLGKKYAYGRTVMPVFELIATVVHGSPGEDGKYRSRRPNSEVREYLEAARRCQGLLLLNIQPGRSEFLDELRYFEKWLHEPDVGVALDPEWAMDPGKIPGRDLGHTTGAELNASADFLQQIVTEFDLPQKVMVFHQFNRAAVTKVKDLKPHDGVALVHSIDGLGGPESKATTYEMIAKTTPKWVHPGFKLFYKEDTNPPWGSRLMTPKEVMALRPQPEYILYE